MKRWCFAAAVVLAAAAGCKEKSKKSEHGAEAVADIEGMSAMPASIDAVLGALPLRPDTVIGLLMPVALLSGML